MWKSGEPDWPNLYVIDFVCTSIKNENIDVNILADQSIYNRGSGRSGNRILKLSLMLST